MPATVPRPRRHAALVALLGFLAITALGGGRALILRPNGSLLGMSTDELATGFFRDFQWPGAVLFMLFGAAVRWRCSQCCAAIGTRAAWP